MSGFDRLVADLHSQERRELLNRISASLTHSDEPLQNPESNDPPISVEEYVAQLGALRRLVLRILSIITASSPYDVIRRRLLRALARRVSVSHPRMLTASRTCCSEALEEETRALAAGASRARRMLDSAVRIHRNELSCVIAGQNLEDVHAGLLLASDASRPIYADLSPQELRASMGVRITELLDSIRAQDRSQVAERVRSLVTLQELSCFEFSQLMRSAGRMGRLYSLLHFLRPPSLSELSAAADVASVDDPQEHQLGLEAIEGFLSAIRRFSTAVPLLSLARLVSGDPAYEPEPPGGGEEWLLMYRRYWQKRLQRAVEARNVDQAREEALARAAAVLGVASLEGGAQSARAVAREYLGRSYSSSRRALQILILSGDFYKTASREMLTSASLYLDGVAEGAEMTADTVAGKLMDLARVLQAVLRLGADEQLDSISNLSAIGGRENEDLRDEWAGIAAEVTSIAGLIRELRALERRSEDGEHP